MAVDYAALKAEISLPAYSGKTDAEIISMLMTKRTASVQKAILSVTDIKNAITLADFVGLTDLQLQQLQTLLAGFSSVDASAGTLVRNWFASIFAGKASLTALAALVAPFDNATDLWVKVQFGVQSVNANDLAAARAA